MKTNKLETVKPVCSDLSEAGHTPTPWARQGFTVFHQRNPGGRKLFICDVSQDAGAAVSPANAAFIVCAVNCHDDLLAALESLTKLYLDSVFAWGADDNQKVCAAFNKACAEITKARGQ